MKRSGLLAVAAVIALATILVSPPLPGVGPGSAWAQTPAPTPTVTVPPVPEPVPAPEPEPPAPVDPGPGSGPAPAPQAPTHPGGNSGGSGGGGSRGGGRSSGGSAPAPTGTPAPTIWWSERPSYSGGYSTSVLSSHAARLRASGASATEINQVYAPFIIAGRAEWSDTFGGIRHASDTGWRPHLGQDVFCDFGAPVLASEHGRVSYGSDATGGLVARVHRSDGSYWYYAHLSSFSNSVSAGEAVSPGDVIGYCGNSGNAVGSPPHVHFGFYSGGVATNPMGALIQWLRTAEQEAARTTATKKPAERPKTQPQKEKEKVPPTLPRTGPSVEKVCDRRKVASVADLLVVEES